MAKRKLEERRMDNSRYHSFEEAKRLMESGQVMGGGEHFDYYFMLDGTVYGCYSCDYDYHEIHPEEKTMESYYEIDGMTDALFKRWIEEGYSKYIPIEEQ